MPRNLIPKNILELSRTYAPEFYANLKVQQPDHYAMGQIWSTKSNIILGEGKSFSSDQPRIVVILDVQETELIAAPISLELQMAAKYDFIVRQSNSPLGFEFLIEVWNEIPVIPMQLNRFLGSIKQDLLELLRDLHVAYSLDEEVNENLQSYVGPVLYERDARFEFQSTEVKAVRYLSQAAIFSLSLPTPSKQPIKPKVFNFGIPLWEKLGNYLRPQVPTIAFASGGETQTEEKAFLIFHGEDTDQTIMQLNVSKRHHSVYLIVRQVGDLFKNQQVVVSLKIHEQTLSSEPTDIVPGVKINLGEFKDFDPSEITEDIQVEIV